MVPQRWRAHFAGVPVAALLTLAHAGPAAAEPCKMGRVGNLPVTMEGLQPLVHASINGTDALFIADSGAFFSMLTPAAAHQFNLQLDHAPFGYAVTGIGGSSETWVTTVNAFSILNVTAKKVPFLVAGSDFGRAAGLLGQNVFRIGDVDYDLANGMITLVRTTGDCRKTSLAYWANAKSLPYSEIDIDSATAEHPHTTGEAYLNGVKIHVVFDTGAGGSSLTLDAAKRAGVTPESPGVAPGGTSYGLGRRVVHTWIAPFASFKIGDEEIRNTHLRISEEKLPRWDMLIGADFFLSHHVFVASNQRKLYFTYNGGPVFNLTTQLPAPAAPGAEPAPAVASTTGAAAADSLDAAGYARRGSASTARRDYGHAIADLSRAIELAPAEAAYFYERGVAYRADRQPDKALADFDQAIKLKPDDALSLIARAQLHLERGDPAEVVRPDLDAADHAAPIEGPARLELGGLYETLHDYPAAVGQFTRWIEAHDREDVHMRNAWNGRCWARALMGQELDRALDDCNAAVRASPRTARFLDSRGLVHLRQGKYAKAIADYDAALAIDPRIPWSLYGRGLAKQHLGQSAAGDADIAAAKALAPKIAEEAASHGIGP